MADDFLEELTRATDIILGALGFDGDAAITSLEKVGELYRGTGAYPDGDSFQFEFDFEPSELEMWAFAIIEKALSGQSNE
ncbi:MAG: hypothetical protein KDD62_04795 [Bdellovibrionales bacterium]|nr:hypothetical protein [Bdellovibrionales bacterium]